MSIFTVHKFRAEGSKIENIADVLWKTLGQSASGDAVAVCENVIGTGSVKSFLLCERTFEPKSENSNYLCYCAVISYE